MKKLIVAAGLAVAGLSAPAMSSPENPTLLETATFLITGSRAEKFTSNGEMLFRKADPGGAQTEFVVRLYYDEKEPCTFLHGFVLGEMDFNKPLQEHDLVEMSLYRLNRLDGNRDLQSKYSEGWGRSFVYEVMTGSKAYCKYNIVDRRIKIVNDELKGCLFVNDNLSRPFDENSDIPREKAWRYLFANHCQASKRPF